MFRAANFEFDNKKFKTGEFPEQNGERGRERKREFQRQSIATGTYKHAEIALK